MPVPGYVFGVLAGGHPAEDVGEKPLVHSPPDVLRIDARFLITALSEGCPNRLQYALKK